MKRQFEALSQQRPQHGHNLLVFDGTRGLRNYVEPRSAEPVGARYLIVVHLVRRRDVPP
jgi:hypothetical protein